MASAELKHRVRDDPTGTDTDTTAPPSEKRPMKLSTRAKRGIPSLALAVSLPLALTAFNIIYFGFPRGAHGTQKLLWFPPLWALHATCLFSSMLMGLSAWLVWAEGGFHKNPQALGLYLAQMGLALSWDPIVFRFGAIRIGMAVAVSMVGSLLGCYRKFKEVNTTAGDLVKLCFAWAGFVCVVNLKLITM